MSEPKQPSQGVTAPTLVYNGSRLTAKMTATAATLCEQQCMRADVWAINAHSREVTIPGAGRALPSQFF